MLICKNCFTPNAEGSTTCTTCKMPGMLVRDNTIVLPDRESGLKSHVNCRNCGHGNLENQSHCTRCKFPLLKATEPMSDTKNIQNN